jgi:excisionase family DNA binding protein
MNPLSTREVAQLVGIDRATLERWIAGGQIARPKELRIGNKAFRHWTRQDIQRVKRYKATHYRKGRGRKPKSKR